MAQCKLTPHEFIQNAFSPMVAVMCSPMVDHTCQKNNLSFIEMIQPFCKLNCEAHVKDPSGNMIAVRNLRITMFDINSRPPQPTLARKFLNESVNLSTNERNTSLDIGGQTVDVPASVPWFEAWRETFLQVQFPSDHEFTKHYISCVLVVSSGEPSVADALQQMTQQLNQLQGAVPSRLPKWFCPGVSTLRYYVLLHDATDGSSDRLETAFEAMKNLYGPSNCYLLQTNSRPPGHTEELSLLPDPWSQFLIRQLDSQESSEQDSSPRTPVEVGGVTGMPSRLTIDTDTLELAQEAGEGAMTVTNHPLSPDADMDKTPGHINANVWAGQAGGMGCVQHGACLTVSDLDRLRGLVHEFCVKALLPFVERQQQQLSDAVSNKKGVSRSLLTATKRWFGSNKPGLPGLNTPVNAVTYSSDAPELQLRRLGDLCFMFGHYALAFQAYHSAKRDFNADQAWLYYAGALEMASLSAFMQGESSRKAQEYMEESILTYLNSCKVAQFATRATLLSTECLKGRGLYGEAAKQLIRMTSEDSDLRSALLLEQASYCFIKAARPRMARKYAFHIVLAGHRFSKAGQRRHSLRCYRQAYQIYEHKNWSLAEDHIHFTIGRQAANLKQLLESANAFSHLLTPASRQSATQQVAFLREFLSIQQQLVADEIPVLPLPLVELSSLRVLVGPLPPEMHTVLDEASNIPATGITFQDITSDGIRWTRLEELLLTETQGAAPMIFKPTVQLFTNQTNNTSSPIGVVGEPVSICISMHNPLQVALPLHDLQLMWTFPGNVQSSVLDTLVLAPSSSQDVVLSLVPQTTGELLISGMSYRLASALPEPSTPALTVVGQQVLSVPSGDKRLHVTVVPTAPCLKVSFCGLITELLCGELRLITLNLSNIGNAPLTSVLVSSSAPVLSVNGDEGGQVCCIPLAHPLNPGQSHSATMWMRAPDTRGATTIDMLVYYENAGSTTVPRYRLVRHSWQLTVTPSVELNAITMQSHGVWQDVPLVQNLALQVKNSNEVHDILMTEISLLQVSLVSHGWRLSDKVVMPRGVHLQAQERVHIVLTAHRYSSQDPEDRGISDLALNDSETHLESFGERPYLGFIPNEKNVSGSSLDALLILRWQAQVTVGRGSPRLTIGQHHLCLGQTRESGTSPLEKLQRLVTYSAQHPPRVAHNFSRIRLCVVPVQLRLQNCSDIHLMVKVSTLECSRNSTGTSPSNQLYSPRAASSFHWVGLAEAWLELCPRGTAHVGLSAALGAPGTFDLGTCLEVQCRGPDAPETGCVTQNWRLESSLIVSNASL